MEHWEFLLQKEGDRSWLPLDSPAVEILEGRYRIVARSSNVNAAIETRITHVATEAMPPKRRVQKRSCRTNQDGLMVVIPFTRLEPGLWELQCSPADLLTDLMAGAQPYAVTLQVVARESEEDWEPDWTAPTDLATTTAQVDLLTEAVTASADNALREEALSEPALSEVTLGRSPAVGSPAVEQPLPPTNDRSSVMPPEVAEILGASMDRLFQIAEQLSEQLVDEVLQDFDLTAIASAAPIDAADPGDAAKNGDAVKNGDRAATTAATVATAVPASVGPLEVPDQLENGLATYTLSVGEAFWLTLDQAAFVAAQGEALTVTGQVAIVPHTAVQAPSGTTTQLTSLTELDVALPDIDPCDEAALNLTGATAQSLQLCLRDPQSLQVLVSERQPLPATTPSSFTFSFSLPATFSTHLVLGEVLLCGSLAGTEDSIALVTQAFSITVDPTALVGELAKLHEALTTDIDDERLDLPLELSSRLKETSPLLDLSFLNSAVVEPPDEPPHFPSLAGQPLPPQLYRPALEQAPKPLDLPAFKLTNALEQSAVSQAEGATSEPSGSDAIAASVTEAETSAAPASEAAQAASDLAQAVPSKALDDQTQLVVPAEVDAAVAPDRVSTDSTEPMLDLPSPTQMAFQSLKLQDRFLTRLTSLATDTELAALLKANRVPERMPSSAATAPSLADARSLIEEIVVDDEPEFKERDRHHPNPTLAAAVDAPPNPLVLPADDAVPMPTLEVITGELIAGKPINIRVKLPNLLPRIYVKLWVIDRQTRSLLDAPRWLVDFLPNGLGDLEAMTPLTVPFGSVELRLEAIAVEMHTQRESHKVTVDRVVVPPDLPSVSLDDFSD